MYSSRMMFCYDIRRIVTSVLLCIVLTIEEMDCIGEVIWAVNCGGDTHTDVHGVRYQKDVLLSGVASDYGKNMLIQRVMPQDQILYQTERYHTDTFGYEVPIRQDGDYVLVLKFSEVWFASQNQKVFDVLLNGEHTVVDDIDIFARVGHSTGHDELIPFSVKNGKLKVSGETSLLNGKLSVEFVKGDYDNPKVNAIYVMRGAVEDVPKLLPLVATQTASHPAETGEDEEEEEEPVEEEPKKPRRRAVPTAEKVSDPYAADDTSSMMLPVFIAVSTFLPLLFCLCKL